MAGTQTGFTIFGPQGISFKRVFSDTLALSMKLATTPTASWTVSLPPNPPASTRALTMSSTGEIGYVDLGGGGTVTSVAMSVPSFLSVANSPITTSGTLAVTLATQTANTIFAGPSTGVAAEPTFRSLVYNDLSALVGTAANTLAAGNDSRIHTQNSDTGTTAAGFQIDSGNGGPRVKNNSGILEVRNAADNALASLRILDLFVTGTTTTINSETVAIADNIVVLNSNVTTGIPSEDAGLWVSRGASTAASLLWNETTDHWTAGLVGSEKQLARIVTFTFTNADLVSGIYTLTHNLDNQYLGHPTIYDNNNKIIIPDDYTATSANVLTTDLTSFGAITGTWRITVVG